MFKIPKYLAHAHGHYVHCHRVVLGVLPHLLPHLQLATVPPHAPSSVPWPSFVFRPRSLSDCGTMTRRMSNVPSGWVCGWYTRRVAFWCGWKAILQPIPLRPIHILLLPPLLPRIIKCLRLFHCSRTLFMTDFLCFRLRFCPWIRIRVLECVC